MLWHKVNRELAVITDHPLAKSTDMLAKEKLTERKLVIKQRIKAYGAGLKGQGSCHQREITLTLAR